MTRDELIKHCAKRSIELLAERGCDSPYAFERLGIAEGIIRNASYGYLPFKAQLCRDAARETTTVTGAVRVYWRSYQSVTHG